jgi:hypothetical protein
MAATPGHRTNATQVGSSLKETDIERLRQRLHDTINSSAVRYRDIERSTGLPGYQVRNFVNAITKKPSLHLLGTLYSYFQASEPRPTSTSLSPLVSRLLRLDERAGPQSIKEFQGVYFCLRRSFQDIDKANLSLVRIRKGRNRFARFSHTFYITPNGGRVHRHLFIGAAFLLGNKLHLEGSEWSGMEPKMHYAIIDTFAGRRTDVMTGMAMTTSFRLQETTAAKCSYHFLGSSLPTRAFREAGALCGNRDPDELQEYRDHFHAHFSNPGSCILKLPTSGD